ncbi:hypothetical protein HMN09_00475400 [Mycena chlorophos]|uniref:Uncharacterized protein n=1 Tax=Mycena chlorophos TaxID=658473 RepID=A0A8H6THH4_MYCCL|nr:hypothetical protein HMN09_00475400 [Mycena chlorophos]
MPTHTAADTAYIERLPSAVIAAFRNDQFEPAHCAANAVDFLEDDWINIKHLKAFVGDKGAELLASLADSTRPVSDADYVRRVPHGILTSFRNTGRRAGFLTENASDFLGTEWVKPAQLRRFTEDWKSGGATSSGNESAPVSVKQEETVVPLASAPTALRVRASRDELGREILELLSDSEVSDAEMADITGACFEPRTSSPAPSLMSLLIPDTTSLFTPSSEPSPVEDNPATYLPSPNTNLPPASHMLPPIPDLARLLELDSNGQPLYLQLPISDTLWADDIVSYVLIGPFQVTSKETVERVEYLRELPSLWPIPKVRTAFVLDLRDPKFAIRDPKYETREKSGDGDNDVLLTVDALVKDADNDPWRGNTGVGDSKSHVQFSPGGPRLECRRARLTCPGCHACEHVPENLVRVERRDLSTEQREAIFKAQTEARRLQGTTPERRVAEFVAVVRKHRCPAAAVDGRPCDGAPIPIRLAQPFQGHTFAIGCSSSPPLVSPQASGHRLINIPFNVDEKMALKAIAGQPVASDASKDTPACSGIVPPTTGGRRKTCAGEHIKNGIAAPSARIKHYPCRAKRTIFVPLDGLRIAVVLHGEFGHDHVLPPITHPSHLLKARFFDLLDIVGVILADCDSAAVVRHVLGGKTLAQVAPAFQSVHLRQRLVRERKHQMFPHGLGLEGARHLFLEDQALPPNERYVHRFVELDDGKVIILTCDPRLLRFLDDPGVTSFEADTTYKRTNGEIDELEIVTYVSAYASAVTIGRVYVNGRSAAYFERVFDELIAVKLELTGKPIAFKIFGEGGNLLAFNSDMDSAQVLGFTRAIRKQVNFDLAPQLRDLTTEQLAPRLVKLCLTHAKRALLDFRGEFPPRHPDYGALFEIFYIDSLDKLNAYSALIRRLGKPRIQAWWDHKNLSEWILPCLVRELSPMPQNDFDSTPATTNTGEGQHHRTNKRTGTKLPVVEAIISGRIVDHSTRDQFVHTDVIHQLPNPRNESSHRFARKLGRQQTALHQTQAAHAEEENRARLDAEIAAGAEYLKGLKAERKALPPKRKGGGGRRRTGESSSGRVPVKYTAPENSVPSSSAAPLPEHMHLRAQQPMPTVFPAYPSQTNVIPRLSGLPTSDFTFASSMAPPSLSAVTPPSAFTTHSMALGPVPSAGSATVPYLQQSAVSPYGQTMPVTFTMPGVSMASPFVDPDTSTVTGTIYPGLDDFDIDWSYLDAFVAGDIALPTHEPAEATLASGSRQAPDPAPQPPLYVAPSDTILPLPAPSPSPPPASSGVGEKRKDRDEDTGLADGGEDGTGGQAKRLCVRRSERNTGMKKKAWPPRDYEREYA